MVLLRSCTFVVLLVCQSLTVGPVDARPNPLKTKPTIPADNQKSDATTTTPSRPRRICILCEPSPLTYLSGQAGRFTALMDHLANSVEYNINTTAGDPSKLENAYLHLITSEKAHPNPPTCYQPPNLYSANQTTTPRIPVHYTQGIELPFYRGLTMSIDWTCKSLRVLFPRRDRKFDLIHVSTGMLVFPAILASRLYSIPLVISYHTHLPVYFRSYFSWVANLAHWCVWKLIQLVHKFADVTLLMSEPLLQEFQAHGIRRCYIWPKGIDTHRFHPRYRNSTMRQRMMGEHAEDKECFLLVYIGRLAREKRLEELKHLLEKLNKDGSTNYRLCFVGSGPIEGSLQKHFDDTPTTFLGRLSGDELSQAFASGDAFVMPSDSETLGFVVLESMASGVPCVAARALGLMDIIQHNETGLLAKTGVMEEFAEHVRSLRANRYLYGRLALDGRTETEKWSWESSVKHVQGSLYNQAEQNFQNRPEQRFARWIKAVGIKLLLSR